MAAAVAASSAQSTPSVSSRGERKRRPSLSPHLAFLEDGSASFVDTSGVPSFEILDWLYSSSFDPSTVRYEPVLKLKSDGTWTRTVMKLTKDVLAFTLEKENLLVDMIPLHEIDTVAVRSTTRKPSFVRGSGSPRVRLKTFDSLRPRGSVTGGMDRTDSAENASNFESGALFPSSFPSNADSEGKQESDFMDIEIATSAHGFNSGRKYVLRFSNARKCQEWIDTIRRAGVECRKSMQEMTPLEKARNWARSTYKYWP